MAKRAGFTLIEMLVVLAILGFSLAFVATRGPGRSDRLELDGAARDVAGAMRFARSRAIALDRPVSVGLDVPAHALRIDGSPSRALPPRITATLSAPPRAGVAPSIVFAPDGSATGGSVDLSARARRIHVAVDWLSGRVSLAEDAPS